MESFVAVLHLFVALVLIVLVLVQDSKGGGMGGAFGGGGSNSVLGATGATTLAQKMTRYAAIIFAGTCITLTIFSARSHKSVIDMTAPAAATTAPSTDLANPAATPTPAAAAPAASAEPAQAEKK